MGSMKPNSQVAERFWVVGKEASDGTKVERPDRKAVRHKTEQEAITNAEQLSAKYPNTRFWVLESVGFAQKIVPSTFTYVAD